MEVNLFGRISAALRIAAMMCVSCASAQAALISGPVPDSKTVVWADLRWAYASPVAVTDYHNVNILLEPSDNGNVGWRYATAEEWANRPDISLFLALPGGGNDAVRYWNTGYTHIDTVDYTAGNVTSYHYGDPGFLGFDIASADTIYVKDLSSPPVPDTVPEPGTFALLGLGGLGLGVRAIRQRWCRGR